MDELQKILDQITDFYEKMKDRNENCKYNFTIEKDRCSEDKETARIRLTVA